MRLCPIHRVGTFERMILEALAQRNVRQPLLEALRPQATSGQRAAAGEERLVLGGVSWPGYLKLDSVLGHERGQPRLYYLDGELEIMTTSLRHERLKEWLGGFVEDYLFQKEVEAF